MDLDKVSNAVAQARAKKKHARRSAGVAKGTIKKSWLVAYNGVTGMQY